MYVYTAKRERTEDEMHLNHEMLGIEMKRPYPPYAHSTKRRHLEKRRIIKEEKGEKWSGARNDRR